MGKEIKWMGPWEDLRENDAKFQKMCLISSRKDNKALKSFNSTKPDKVALFSCITNPRGFIFPIGKDEWGYQNTEYLNWWQRTAQAMWNELKSIYEARICTIVDLQESDAAGLYDDNSLPEQFPGKVKGSGQWFGPVSVGDFEQRGFGGWRWFGLLTSENWDGSWQIDAKPAMDTKNEVRHSVAPKYYTSYHYNRKGNFVEDSKSPAVYAVPKGVKYIKRRMYWPVPSETRADSPSIQRYNQASQTIMKRFGTMWTLAIWNSIDCLYTEMKNNTHLILKPEITISLGRFSDNPDGKKVWGKHASHLHRHWEGVYKIIVGLNDKTKIRLVTHEKKEKSPIWDGTYKKLWELMKDPYQKLINLGINALVGLLQQ